MVSKAQVALFREWLAPGMDSEIYDRPTDAAAARIARDAIPAMADMLTDAAKIIRKAQSQDDACSWCGRVKFEIPHRPGCELDAWLREWDAS